MAWWSVEPSDLLISVTIEIFSFRHAQKFTLSNPWLIFIRLKVNVKTAWLFYDNNNNSPLRKINNSSHNLRELIQILLIHTLILATSLSSPRSHTTFQDEIMAGITPFWLSLFKWGYTLSKNILKSYLKRIQSHRLFIFNWCIRITRYRLFE